jgi:hypothetical protein
MFVLYQMDIWGYIHMNYTKLFVSCFTWDFGGKNFLASNGNQFVGDSWRWSWYSLFLDETLINFIKTMHLAKGEREDKERGPKSKPKAHKPKGGSQGGKETNYVQEPHRSQETYPKKIGKGNLKM